MKFTNLIMLLIMIGCTHVASISQTSIPAKKGKLVKAEVDNNIILLLNFSNSYVDALNDKLVAQCEKGNIQGVFTKHERITYFPIIFHKERITAEGYCND